MAKTLKTIINKCDDGFRGEILSSTGAVKAVTKTYKTKHHAKRALREVVSMLKKTIRVVEEE